MKKIFFITIGLIMISVVFLLKISTKDEFDLNKQDYIELKKQLDSGNLQVIEKLDNYYYYSIQDYNKSIAILRYGAEQGNAMSQYRLSLYFLRNYYPYGKKESFEGEGLFWLRKSAKLGYLSAIEELKKYKGKTP